MKQLTITNNKEKAIFVDDPYRFIQHLFDFHILNGEADLSLHEENSHYFMVTKNLIEEANNFISKNKIEIKYLIESLVQGVYYFLSVFGPLAQLVRALRS
tara:strand:+ start:408 stop:707 length:300 start_codon:yes stop_codon:yes gene_type:complete